MGLRRIMWAAAAAVLAAGLLLPAGMLASYFYGDPRFPEPMLTGAVFFRVGLIVSGAYMIALLLFTRLGDADDPGPALAKQNAWQRRVFIALLLVAAGLRLYKLGNGIWYDEMLTWVQYMPLGLGRIVSTFSDPNNHLLYSVLARISLSVFGESVWAFRLPAALFGIGSIAAIYYFARRVTSANIALFSAALLVFSYHHIWFSQNARGYSMMLFFTVISSSYLLDALRTNTPRRWLYYALAAALGAATHLTMAFVLVAQFAIWLFLMLRRAFAGQRWNGLFLGFIPLGLMMVQAYAFVLPGMLGGNLLNTGLQGSKIAWTNPLWALGEVVRGLQIGFAGGGVVAVSAVIFSVGFVWFLRHRPAVAVLFAVPVVLGIVLMVSIGYTLFPRFFFFAMGFGVVIVMQGAAQTGAFLSHLLHVPARRAALLPLLLCAGIVASQLPSLRWVHLRKQNYEDAIALVQKQMQPGDTVAAVGIADFPLNKYYRLGWETVMNNQELTRLEGRKKTVWLVYTMPLHAKVSYPGILARIGKDYELVKSFHGSLHGGEVVVARMRPSGVGQGN